MICQSPDGKIMCLAIFVPFSSFFLGNGRTQGLIWADDPYLPHCPRLLKHWISGLTCSCLWQNSTSASEKIAPRNPWIIVFFFSPGSSLSELECHFFGYITVYPSFRHFFLGQWGAISCGALLWRTRATDWNCPGTRQSFVARRGCFDPIDTWFSHVFTVRHGERFWGWWLTPGTSSRRTVSLRLSFVEPVCDLVGCRLEDLKPGGFALWFLLYGWPTFFRSLLFLNRYWKSISTQMNCKTVSIFVLKLFTVSI